jgi:tetratricopeptide (TPR) repeat protein
MLRIRFHSVFVVLSAIGVVTCALPQRAFGQTSASDTARATDLFKDGKAAFAKGEMAEAERMFSQAFAIRKSSDIAANLAQSELEQQKFRSAAEHFSWALANLLPSASDAQRKAVETGLAKARAEVAMLRLDIRPDGSDVLVGAEAVGKSPITHGVYVDPGEVIVSVKHDGFVSIEKRVMAGKGTEQAVEIELTAKDAASAPADAQAKVMTSGLTAADSPADSADYHKPKSLVPAFVATGVAVAGGAFGLGFTLSANGKEDDADDLRDRLEEKGGCNGGAPASDCDELKDQRESVDSSRNLAIGSFVVGGVAALVAGYFYWDALSHRSKVSARKPRPLYGLLPSLQLERAESSRSVAAVRSMKLAVSGTF